MGDTAEEQGSSPHSFDLTRIVAGSSRPDLFGEHGQFADTEHFWESQNAAIAEAVEAYKADGWKEAVSYTHLTLPTKA